ncbi:MAG: oligosaccharide flippase family protein [SAR324 cluster bacterium]|nr:oligosaccharide flippase family protein [SAR324 cluster bacterium]
MSLAENIIARYLPPGSFLRNVFVLAGGTAFGHGLIVLSAPLLTRLYTPAEFGALSVYTSILTILLVVSALRYEWAIPLPADDEAAIRLFWLSILLVSLTALLILLVQALAGDFLVARTGTAGLRPLLWLLPLGLFAAGILAAFNRWTVRKKQYAELAKVNVTHSSAQVATQIAAGFAGAGSLGLVLGQLVGQFSGLFTYVNYSAKDIRTLRNPLHFGELRKVASRYKRFPIYSSGSALLTTAVGILPPLVLASLFGMQVAGWFALGQRVVALPTQLIAQAIGDIYFAEASQAAQQGNDALRRIYRRFALRLLVFGLGILVPIALLGPSIFELAFGASWREAGVYIRPMVIMFLAQFIAYPLSQTLLILEHQDRLLFWDGIRFCGVIAVFVAAQYFQLTPEATIFCYALSIAASYMALLLVSTNAVRKLSV